jgi:hypothetical protein
VTREEHQAILAFFEETVGGSQPPMDIEADAIIRALFVRNPDAAYRMTMRAISLVAASQQAAAVPRRGWLFNWFERRGGSTARVVF